MPKPFLDALSKCQDSLPAVDFIEIKNTIESEFGQPISSIFQSIEQVPLAVASIASVHKAVLLDGRQVVVKVQHSNVAEKLLLDLKCLETIGDTIRYLEPDFDMSPVIREWSKEVPKELDFRKEKLNQETVAANLKPFYHEKSELGFDVNIPKTIDGLVSKKVLVMEYIDGFKIDKNALDAKKIDKELVLSHITRAYGQMIFQDGLFQADNHPGNLLIDSKTHEPVLLDFGLTKELDSEMKAHLAKFLVSCDEQDIYGILDSLDKIGLKFRSDVPFDIQLLSKYFFRDAKPSEEAKKENQERRKEWKETQEKSKVNFYAGDYIDVTLRNLVGLRNVKKAEIVKVVDDDILMVKYTNGDESFVKKEQCKLQKTRSPINSWPDTFIFFERVLNLLRGLSASMDVRTSYFENMIPFARKSLQKYDNTGTEIIGIDQLGLKELVSSMLVKKDILGAQICVIKNKKIITNIAAGVSDPYDMCPTNTGTVFNSFSVTKAISATAILLMVEDGLIDLNKPVSFYWPEFAKNGKESITVKDVLNHKGGLQNAGTTEIADDPLLVCDNDKMIKLVEDSVPENLGKTAYHYLSFGWILQGLTKKVSGMYLDEYVENKIANKIGINEEFMIGTSRQNNVANLVLKRFEMPEQKKETNAADLNGKRPSFKPSLLLNPTFFNNPKIMAASIPSANGFFSAQALAKFYSAIVGDDLFPNKKDGVLYYIKSDNDEQIESIKSDMVQGGDAIFKLGFQVYSNDDDHIYFGHNGLGGSIAMTAINKKTGENIQIAITLNRLNIDAKVTRQIMRKIFNELKMKIPSNFLRD